MTKFFRALFKCEKNWNWLKQLVYIFVVHSNETACRKIGLIGLHLGISCHPALKQITGKLTTPMLPSLITVVNKLLSTMFFLLLFGSSSTYKLIKPLIHMKHVTPIFSFKSVNVLLEDPKKTPLRDLTAQTFPTLT